MKEENKKILTQEDWERKDGLRYQLQQKGFAALFTTHKMQFHKNKMARLHMDGGLLQCVQSLSCGDDLFYIPKRVHQKFHVVRVILESCSAYRATDLQHRS